MFMSRMTCPYLVSGHGKKQAKFDINAITFDIVAQIQ